MARQKAVQHTLTVSEIRYLKQNMLEEPVKHVSQLSSLVAAINHGSDEVAVEAINVCRPFFVEALHNGLTSSACGEGKASQLAARIAQKFGDYWEALLACYRSSMRSNTQVAACHAVMEVVRAEKAGQFENERFHIFVVLMLLSANCTAEALDTFVNRFLQYDDVQYYLAHVVRATAQGILEGIVRSEGWHGSSADIVGRILHILEHWPPGEEESRSWCGGVEAGLVTAAPKSKEGARARRKRKAEAIDVGSNGQATVQWASAPARRQALSEAWIAFLGLPLSTIQLKQAVSIVTGPLMQRLTRPLLLSDFLTKCVDQGGYLGILALNGLFLLVTAHGLEYPAFYKRLYNLLSPQMFTARYRTRFLRLVDVFLASSLVPAYSIAAFVKRFASLALTAPPHGALACIAFVHNLLRRHPACMCLLHRAPSQDDTSAGVDVYDPEQPDPSASRAVESSLWELQALRCHYDHQVSAAVSMLDRDLRDRKQTSEVDLSEVLTHSYAAAITQELSRKLRAAPVVSDLVANPEGKEIKLFNSLPLGSVEPAAVTM